MLKAMQYKHSACTLRYAFGCRANIPPGSSSSKAANDTCLWKLASLHTPPYLDHYEEWNGGMLPCLSSSLSANSSLQIL